MKRFEELIAWQKARALTKVIFQVTKQGEFSRNYSLAAQIQRVAVSIMSNIAEA
jgi:four helix bundle protein